MATVKVLLVGYFKWVKKDICRASSTVTYIEDEKEKIIVDTGNICDGEKLIKALDEINVAPEEITTVVNTHLHLDHIGCNFLFKKARLINSEEVCLGDEFTLVSTDNFSLTENTKIIATPGHTLYDCSVITETKEGKVVVAGDLFWEEAREKSSFITDEKLYKQSQEKILKLVDYIVPGHGNIFKKE